jgi:protein-disulfide isomerase
MNNRGLLILGAVVLVAVIAVVGVVFVSNNANSGPAIDFSQIPQSRGEDGSFILGNPDAPVTLVEFADFVCPHCVTYEPTVKQFIQNYVVTGQAAFEYRMFPTAGGDMTRFAGQIAECAEDQRPGAFWEAYALLYDLARNGQYNQELGQRVANALNLSYAELLNCSTTAQQVTTDVAFGRNQGVQGTPAVRVRYGNNPAQLIVVNGQPIDGGGATTEQLMAMMAAAQTAQ